MKHFYRRLILCVVIFLLIFILFNITANKENVKNVENVQNKNGLIVTDTNKLLSSNNINSITSNFSYLFVNLKNPAVILDSTSKITFMPINYTCPAFNYQTLCNTTNDDDVHKFCQKVDQTALQNYINNVNFINNLPSKYKKPKRILSQQNTNTNNVTSTNYNIITDTNNNPITTNIYNNNYNGTFTGLNTIMNQMINEIFKLTLIESNIIYYINRQNAPTNDSTGNFVFSGITDPPNLINNVYDDISKVNSSDTANMLKLGAFKINNIQNKSIQNIIDDIVKNNYINISTYFDDNIIYEPDVNITDIHYTSSMNFDNINKVNTLGISRTKLNNQRNSLIYKLCLMSKLYIQGGIQVTQNRTVYDDLSDYLNFIGK